MILITSQDTHALVLKDVDANVVVAVILVTPGEAINYTEPVRTAIEEHFSAEEVTIFGDYILDIHSYHTMLKVESLEDEQECVRYFHLDKGVVYALPTKSPEADARKLLREQGFFVDNLWHVDDVKGKFNCTNEEAQEVLEQSLTNEATMEQIWFSIREFGSMNDLEEISDDDDESVPLVSNQEVIKVGANLKLTVEPACIDYVLDNYEAESKSDPSGARILWIEKLIYEYIEHTKD